MDTPVIKSVTEGGKKALNVKNIVYVAILTLIIVLLAKKAFTQTLVITDTTGKVVGGGEIITTLKFPKRKAA